MFVLDIPVLITVCSLLFSTWGNDGLEPLQLLLESVLSSKVGSTFLNTLTIPRRLFC